LDKDKNKFYGYSAHPDHEYWIMEQTEDFYHAMLYLRIQSLRFRIFRDRNDAKEKEGAKIETIEEYQNS
jgi:hypothetical protein